MGTTCKKMSLDCYLPLPKNKVFIFSPHFLVTLENYLILNGAPLSRSVIYRYNNR